MTLNAKVQTRLEQLGGGSGALLLRRDTDVENPMHCADAGGRALAMRGPAGRR
jgi:hypothetical protein